MTHATVICEICGDPILTCNLEDLRVPMVGSMFSCLPNLDFNWHPEVEWRYMRCPYCGFRPFGAGDGFNADPNSLTVKVADGKPFKYTIPTASELTAEGDEVGEKLKAGRDDEPNTKEKALSPGPLPAPSKDVDGERLAPKVAKGTPQTPSPAPSADPYASMEVGGAWVEPIIAAEGDGMPEVKDDPEADRRCVCGKVCKTPSGLKAHQRRCQTYQDLTLDG